MSWKVSFHDGSAPQRFSEFMTAKSACIEYLRDWMEPGDVVKRFDDDDATRFIVYCCGEHTDAMAIVTETSR